jgi:hypothetical protein
MDWCRVYHPSQAFEQIGIKANHPCQLFEKKSESKRIIIHPRRLKQIRIKESSSIPGV